MKSIKTRLQRTFPTLLVAHAPVVGIVGGTLAFHFLWGIPLSYLGMISSVSVMIWSFSATLYSFCHSLLAPASEKEGPKGFLIFSALFAWLLFLDGLLFVQGEVFTLPLLKQGIKLAYALFLVYYLLRFGRGLLKSDFFLWFLALGCFGLFVLEEAYSLSPHLVARCLFEDAPKFLGIAAWGAYAFRTARQFVLYRIRQSLRD